MEIFRYYQAAVVNTLFGVGMYSLFVFLGLNMFVAQIVSHVLGVVFNYFTYSRHVFRESRSNKAYFFLSYAANYVVSLGTLLVVSRFVHSPYIAGLIATFLVSIINYFVLKNIVFRTKAA